MPSISWIWQSGQGPLRCIFPAGWNTCPGVSQISCRSSMSLIMPFTLPDRLFSFSARLTSSSLTCPWYVLLYAYHSSLNWGYSTNFPANTCHPLPLACVPLRHRIRSANSSPGSATATTCRLSTRGAACWVPWPASVLPAARIPREASRSTLPVSKMSNAAPNPLRATLTFCWPAQMVSLAAPASSWAPVARDGSWLIIRTRPSDIRSHFTLLNSRPKPSAFPPLVHLLPGHGLVQVRHLSHDSSQRAEGALLLIGRRPHVRAYLVHYLLRQCCGSLVPRSRGVQGHAQWTWTCTMDMDAHHEHGKHYLTVRYRKLPLCSPPFLVSIYEDDTLPLLLRYYLGLGKYIVTSDNYYQFLW